MVLILFITAVYCASFLCRIVSTWVRVTHDMVGEGCDGW